MQESQSPKTTEEMEIFLNFTKLTQLFWMFIDFKSIRLSLKVTLWFVAVKLYTFKKERTQQIKNVGGTCTCVLGSRKHLGVPVGCCSPGAWSGGKGASTKQVSHNEHVELFALKCICKASKLVYMIA